MEERASKSKALKGGGGFKSDDGEFRVPMSPIPKAKAAQRIRSVTSESEESTAVAGKTTEADDLHPGSQASVDVTCADEAACSDGEDTDCVLGSPDSGWEVCKLFDQRKQTEVEFFVEISHIMKSKQWVAGRCKLEARFKDAKAKPFSILNEHS